MAQAYRVEIAAPKTTAGAARIWQFDGSTGNVSSVECDLKSGHHAISSLHVKLHDESWDLFNQLPDPAFANVPVRLYLAPPGNPRSPSVLVFDGKLTTLEPDYPGPQMLTVEAHDKSIDARRPQRVRTYRNKTSVQIAQAIAADYGYTVDVSLGTAIVSPRSIDIGMPASTGDGRLSDWDHLCRALAADGLEVHIEGSKLHIRQAGTLVYPITFTKGREPILKFAPRIQHVRGPGEGGNTKTPIALEQSGTKQAETGARAKEAALEGADKRTHRQPIAGAANAAAAHTEDVPRNWESKATQLRRRKDTATLVTTPLPDLTPKHIVNTSGYGGKADGPWFVHSVRHHLVGTEYGSTTTSLARAPSSGAAKAAGIAAEA